MAILQPAISFYQLICCIELLETWNFIKLKSLRPCQQEDKSRCPHSNFLVTDALNSHAEMIHPLPTNHATFPHFHAFSFNVGYPEPASSRRLQHSHVQLQTLASELLSVISWYHHLEIRSSICVGCWHVSQKKSAWGNDWWSHLVVDVLILRKGTVGSDFFNPWSTQDPPRGVVLMRI